jgi:addiction module RelE/StbE family toxin
MRIKRIYISKDFKKQLITLPKHIQKKAVKSEILFRENPLHPSLRLHKLNGKMNMLWSISIDKSYRIIFEILDNGDILFMNIGRHSIYK